MSTTVSNYTELQGAILAAVSGTPLYITFNNSILMDEGAEPLTIASGTHVEFDMQEYKLYINKSTPPAADYAMLTIESGAEFKASTGIFEYNGASDSSFAHSVNTISNYGISEFEKCYILNYAESGNASSIDVLGGTVEVNYCNIEAHRYGVRICAMSKTTESALFADGSIFTGGARGVFVYQPSSNDANLARFDLTGCKITANQGIYFLDSMTTPEEGETLKGILRAGTIIRCAQQPHDADAWLPGYEGAIQYDQSTPIGAGHIKIAIYPKPRKYPVSSITFFNKYKMRG